MSDKKQSLADARAIAYTTMVVGCPDGREINRRLDALIAAAIHEHDNPPETIPCKCGKVMLSERHILKTENSKPRYSWRSPRVKFAHSKDLCDRSAKKVQANYFRVKREKDVK